MKTIPPALMKLCRKTHFSFQVRASLTRLVRTFEGEKYPVSLMLRYQVLYQASQPRHYTLEDIMNTNESITHKAADKTERKLLVNLYLYASAQINISLFH